MSEIEQRYMIKFLYAKKFALDRIVAELASVYREHAYVSKAVEYWIHQVELRRSDMEYEATLGRPALDDVEARILMCFSHILLDPLDCSRSGPGARDSLSTPRHILGHATSTLPMGLPRVDPRIEGSADISLPSSP
jgi:hypothetical protein